jgi:hypothetical protein
MRPVCGAVELHLLDLPAEPRGGCRLLLGTSAFRDAHGSRGGALLHHESRENAGTSGSECRRCAGRTRRRRCGLLLEDPSGATWQAFTPGKRLTAHAHHASKYADTRLPDDKAFRFLSSGGSIVWVAHSVSEFHEAVQSVATESLRRHLVQGDFSRWSNDVLGDQQLARGLRKLERATAAGAASDRAEILAHIESQYLIARHESSRPESLRERQVTHPAD